MGEENLRREAKENPAGKARAENEDAGKLRFVGHALAAAGCGGGFVRPRAAGDNRAKGVVRRRYTAIECRERFCGR